MGLKAGFLASLAGISLTGITLTGCTNSAPPQGGANDPAVVMHSATPSTGHASPGGSPVASGSGQSTASTGPEPSAGPKTKQGAQAAAARFINLYYARQFANSWGLLTLDARQLISRAAWIDVHNTCAPRAATVQKSITSVVLFGESAIITQATPGASSQSAKDTYVLKYANGRWAVSPDDIATYQRGPVTADVAAAKAAGFCGNWKVY